MQKKIEEEEEENGVHTKETVFACQRGRERERVPPGNFYKRKKRGNNMQNAQVYIYTSLYIIRFIETAGKSTVEITCAV